MLAVSNTIKNAYSKYTTQRKSYIRVGNNSFFVQNLDISADAYLDGNVIGNAIAKIVKFDIETVNVSGIDEFELFDGIWTGNQYEYISLGTFKLFDEEGTDDFFSSVTAYDKLIHFNKEYDPSKTTYPTTLYGLLRNICSQAGVELENTSIPNGNQLLESNLFVENETLKNILNAISQISGCFGIISKDKLKLLLKSTETINLNKSQISNPEYKRTTWKINQVVLGMSDVEGEYVLRQDDTDIEKNGVHKLVINDNPFVYTQELRETYIDNLFNQVKGFGYTAFETQWEGLSYVELGDLLNVDGKESIVLRYNLKSPDGLKSTLSAPSIIDSVIEYIDNSNSIKNRQKRTEIAVDKQNQKITAMAETQEEHSSKIAKLEMTDESITQSVNTINNQIIPTSQVSGSYIHIEDSVSAPLINLEIEGKSEQSGESPSPYYPSEIKNVGYENSFDVTKISENTALLSADGTTATSNYSHISDYIEVKANEIYTLIFNYDSLSNSATRAICYYDKNKSFLSGNYYTPSDKKAKISPTEDGYIRFCYDLNCYDIQLTEGNHSYISHGKYGIEVEIVGKNLFDKEKLEQNGISTTGEEIENAYIVRTDFIKVLNNVDYILSFDFNSTIGYDVRVFQYDSNKKILKFDYTNTTKLNFKTETNAAYIRLSFYTDRQITPITYLNHFSNIQLEQNKTNTNFEEYKSIKTQFVLDEPLRSLPNVVKDVAYIKNNKLYIDRYIGSVVLDGSESFYLNAESDFALVGTNYKRMNDGGLCISSHYPYSIGGQYDDFIRIGNNLFLMIKDTRFTKVEEFKTYLSENNVEVQYELAEPYTEELGEIEMPSTLKGVTNITTTDELNPNINIEYVRDTTLSSYVEGQLQNERTIREENIAQLIIEDNQIKQSVSSVSSDLASVNTTINKVEETLTSQDKTIQIISTNIDQTTGAVKEVTTTNGFTFNDKGLNIYIDENSYNTQINNVGTYYKDGNEIVGQTSKDGSLLKNLSQQGQSQYSYDDINKVYEFVEERIEADGEYAYATFYNGEE